MKISPLAMLSLLATLGSPLWGQASIPSANTYFSFLTPSDKQTLLASNELTATGPAASGLPFGVKAPFAEEVRTGLTVKGSTVAIEGFFLFPRTDALQDIDLYNAVNSLASMEGVEYWSVNRKRFEPLILASYRVTSMEKPQKVPDPIFRSVPALQKAIVFQKDNKLGDGYSEVLWRSLPEGGIVMSLKNLQGLNYGILPLVEPGNLQMLFVVLPLADKVAVYGVMEAKTASLFGLERSKDESFRNRMRALAAWLGTRIGSLK